MSISRTALCSAFSLVAASTSTRPRETSLAIRSASRCACFGGRIALAIWLKQPHRMVAWISHRRYLTTNTDVGCRPQKNCYGFDVEVPANCAIHAPTVILQWFTTIPRVPFATRRQIDDLSHVASDGSSGRTAHFVQSFECLAARKFSFVSTQKSTLQIKCTKMTILAEERHVKHGKHVER